MDTDVSLRDQNGGYIDRQFANETDSADPVQADALTIDIHRSVYTQEQFDTTFKKFNVPSKSVKEKLMSKVKKSCVCNRNCVMAMVAKIFPFLGIMRAYKWKEWLVNDIVAGLCTGVVHIPQSMGFSILTALPPIYGLYTTFYHLLLYFIFGSSRHISVGTMAVTSLMVAAVVEREAEDFQPTVSNAQVNVINGTTNGTDPSPDTDEDELIKFKLGIATSVTLLVGLIHLAMYVLRLGVLASFMSMTFIGGFMTGAGFHIFTSQVPFMLGIKPPRQVGAFRLPKTWYWIFKMMGDTNVAELVISLICIIILFIIKELINERYKDKMKVPIPAEFIVVTLGTIISYFGKLNEKFDVRIIDNIPRGLPAPSAPSMYNSRTYIADAFAIALVIYAVNVSLAKVFAQKHKYNIDQNQELFAYGAMHFISSFFSSFAGAQAPARTFVQVNTGCKTQLSSIIVVFMILLVCLFMGPVLEPLPNSVLAAVITVALFPLFKQFKELPEYYRVNKQDCVVWLVSFLCVTIIDVDLGLYIGIGISLLTVILKTKTVSLNNLSQADNTELFFLSNNAESLTNIPPSIKVVRFDSPLYFANVERFKTYLFKTTLNPHTVEKPTARTVEVVGDKIINKDNDLSGFDPDSNARMNENVTGIVLDCSAMFYIDLMGVNILKQLKSAYDDVGVRFLLANSNEDLIRKFESTKFSTENCFPSMKDAVVFLKNHVSDV